MERISNGPYKSSVICRVLSGDRAISRFQEGKKPTVKWWCQTSFSRHDKIGRISNGPYTGSATRRVPLGDKTFSSFQTGEFPPVNWTCQTTFLHNKASLSFGRT